jgi:hypothetical protein
MNRNFRTNTDIVLANRFASTNSNKYGVDVVLSKMRALSGLPVQSTTRTTVSPALSLIQRYF